MQRPILIYDIECATYGSDVCETEKHKMKFFGAYSLHYNKFFLYDWTQKDAIQKLIDFHKILVGFNTKNYDNLILEREGFNLDFKIKIDLFRVIEQRQNIIMFKKKVLAYQLNSLSLDSITHTLELTTKNDMKMEIDYKIFDKEEFTEEERIKIYNYTERDIELTRKLFDFIEKEFDSWKVHIETSDAKRLVHLSCAPSVYAYKVICHKACLKEEYDNIKDNPYQGAGGYVAYPSVEKCEGNIYCLDFASLYPHIMIQCNLFGRCKNGEEGWNGDGMFKIKGTYNTKEQSKVSTILHEIYKERKALKKAKDSKEYGLKITLNTIYGLLRNPNFKQVYDNVAGEDCCLIGQQCVKLARQRFKDAGYLVLYTDTDSVYIKDEFNNKDKIFELKNKIVEEIKQHIPFPVDTFDMALDYEIDFIHFFKGGTEKDDSELDGDDLENKKLGLMKKNYLFVYKKEDGTKDVYIKNLGIVKRSNSPLSKHIFWNMIVPKIISEHKCKFDNTEIQTWIKTTLEKDIKLITKRINIRPIDNYKNKTSLQAQAYNYIPKGSTYSLKDGIHFFIPNKKIGLGKGMTRYCTLEEYNKFLKIEDISINSVMKELVYFNNNYITPSSKKEKIIKFEDTLKQVGLW